jgi:hypothetical protein
MTVTLIHNFISLVKFEFQLWNFIYNFIEFIQFPMNFWSLKHIWNLI